MNGNKIFVDTNILIYFLKGNQEVIEMLTDKEVIISFITELELLSFPEESENTKAIINELLKNCVIININDQIKHLTVELRQQSNLKLPDSIIAATAKENNLPLLTADKQFNQIQELEVILYEL